jgi:hypothetical protein
MIRGYFESRAVRSNDSTFAARKLQDAIAWPATFVPPRCHHLCQHYRDARPEPPSPWGRLPNEMRVELSMADKRLDGYLGAVLGSLVAVAAVAFLLSGGEWGGEKKVESDKDLPPVTSTTGKAK